MSNGQAHGGLHRQSRGADGQCRGPDLDGERSRLDRHQLHMAHDTLVLAERFVFGMLVPDAQDASAQRRDQEEHDPRAVRWSVFGAVLTTAVGGALTHSMIMIRHSQNTSSVTSVGPPTSVPPPLGSVAPSPVERDDQEHRSPWSTDVASNARFVA